MKKRKILIITLSIFLTLLIIIFLIRLFSETQLDDVSPQIPCEQELLDKADVYYVIPSFEGEDISENNYWCDYISRLDKSLRLHGITHTYKEFQNQDISEQQLNKAIETFEKCFNQPPERFKPPQNLISSKNRNLIKSSNLKLDLYRNLIFHKIYHCDDTGLLSNSFIDWF